MTNKTIHETDYTGKHCLDKLQREDPERFLRVLSTTGPKKEVAVKISKLPYLVKLNDGRIGLVRPTESLAKIKGVEKTVVHICDDQNKPLDPSLKVLSNQFTIIPGAPVLPRTPRVKGLRVEGGPKDFSQYVFDEFTYTKGRLILAVLAKVILDSPDKLNDYSKFWSDARNVEQKRECRFFWKDQLKNGDQLIAVTNQVTPRVVEEFLLVASKSYQITKA